jgi:hypothetical protein
VVVTSGASCADDDSPAAGALLERDSLVGGAAAVDVVVVAVTFAVVVVTSEEGGSSAGAGALEVVGAVLDVCGAVVVVVGAVLDACGAVVVVVGAVLDACGAVVDPGADGTDVGGAGGNPAWVGLVVVVVCGDVGSCDGDSEVGVVVGGTSAGSGTVTEVDDGATTSGFGGELGGTVASGSRVSTLTFSRFHSSMSSCLRSASLTV